jgi:hypothetical protein
MQLILKTLSYLALAALFTAPALYFVGTIPKPPMQTAMLLATALWFSTAPFWMGRKSKDPGAG